MQEKKDGSAKSARSNFCESQETFFVWSAERVVYHQSADLRMMLQLQR